jgi:hypothetical protein
MGYWKMQNDRSLILVTDASEPSTGTWGDRPADVMDAAIARIEEIFEQDLGRKPTKEELRAGLFFHLNARDDLAAK